MDRVVSVSRVAHVTNVKSCEIIPESRAQTTATMTREKKTNERGKKTGIKFHISSNVTHMIYAPKTIQHFSQTHTHTHS